MQTEFPKDQWSLAGIIYISPPLPLSFLKTVTHLPLTLT